MMKLLFSLLLCLCLCDFLSARSSEVLKVKLPKSGTLVGRYLVSHHGKGIRAFLGVPYAEPPVGDLRFKVKFHIFVGNFSTFKSGFLLFWQILIGNYILINYVFNS